MSSPAQTRKPGPVTRARWFARRFVNEARNDVAVAIERDRAARKRHEVALLHPGVHALWAHRVSHALWSN